MRACMRRVGSMRCSCRLRRRVAAEAAAVEEAEILVL